MDTRQHLQLAKLLDSLDGLFHALDEIARSKSTIIKSMIMEGSPQPKAINDFYDTVRRFTTQIDETLKEIRRLM